MEISQTPALKIGGRTDARTVHVGKDRVKLLNDLAIDASFECKRQITTSQFTQYLIDNFSNPAKEKLLKEFKES